MEKVYLVTAEDSTIVYGDSLRIVGAFSTKEMAYDYARVIEDNWEVTEMTVDDPRSNHENEDYPSAYYEE